MSRRREQLPHADAHDQRAVNDQQHADEDPDGNHPLAVTVHSHLRLYIMDDSGFLMSCATNVRHSGNVAIVDLNGTITLSSGIGTIRGAVKDLVEAGHKDILLNLA